MPTKHPKQAPTTLQLQERLLEESETDDLAPPRPWRKATPLEYSRLQQKFNLSGLSPTIYIRNRTLSSQRTSSETHFGMRTPSPTIRETSFGQGALPGQTQDLLNRNYRYMAKTNFYDACLYAVTSKGLRVVTPIQYRVVLDSKEFPIAEYESTQVTRRYNPTVGQKGANPFNIKSSDQRVSGIPTKDALIVRTDLSAPAYQLVVAHEVVLCDLNETQLTIKYHSSNSHAVQVNLIPNAPTVAGALWVKNEAYGEHLIQITSLENFRPTLQPNSTPILRENEKISVVGYYPAQAMLIYCIQSRDKNTLYWMPGTTAEDNENIKRLFPIISDPNSSLIDNLVINLNDVEADFHLPSLSSDKPYKYAWHPILNQYFIIKYNPKSAKLEPIRDASATENEWISLEEYHGVLNIYKDHLKTSSVSSEPISFELRERMVIGSNPGEYQVVIGRRGYDAPSPRRAERYASHAATPEAHYITDLDIPPSVAPLGQPPAARQVVQETYFPSASASPEPQPYVVVPAQEAARNWKKILCIGLVVMGGIGGAVGGAFAALRGRGEQDSSASTGNFTTTMPITTSPTVTTFTTTTTPTSTTSSSTTSLATTSTTTSASTTQGTTVTPSTATPRDRRAIEVGNLIINSWLDEMALFEYYFAYATRGNSWLSINAWKHYAFSKRLLNIDIKNNVLQIISQYSPQELSQFSIRQIADLITPSLGEQANWTLNFTQPEIMEYYHIFTPAVKQNFQQGMTVAKVLAVIIKHRMLTEF